MERNGRFSYSGGSRDVWVTNFSYSWKLAQRGSSKARQRQTIYAWRAEQSALNVELQFRDMDEYRDFAEFARGWHLAVTNGSGQVGVDVPAMIFESDTIPHQTTGEGGMGWAGGIRYAVALPSIPLAYTNGSVGPTMKLTLDILMDESGDLALGSIASSATIGSMKQLTASVTSGSVKTSGAAAFSGIAGGFKSRY